MNKPLALETENLSPEEPRWGNMGGGLLYRYFERKVRFCFYQETLLWGGSERCVQEDSVKGHLYIGAPLGDLEGVNDRGL